MRSCLCPLSHWRDGVRVRAANSKRLGNRLQYRTTLHQDIIVPESEDAIAPLREECRPAGITRPLKRVLAAVDFDDESLRQADEVDDVWPDRDLTPELAIHQAAAPECRPQSGLGIGLDSPESTGEMRLLGWSHVRHLAQWPAGAGSGNTAIGPSPQPSPASGRGSWSRLRGRNWHARGTEIGHACGRGMPLFTSPALAGEVAPKARVRALTAPGAWRSPRPGRPGSSPWSRPRPPSPRTCPRRCPSRRRRSRRHGPCACPSVPRRRR